MTDPILWTLVFLQMMMGVYDVLYHHEFTERLAWRPTASTELALHAVRNLFYAVLFFGFAWFEFRGIYAAVIAAILGIEVLITLWDFVEEDLSRKLPATERVTHTLLALNYGAILAYLMPVLIAWYREPTAITSINYGLGSLVLTFAGFGVLIFALRDTFTSRRVRSLPQIPAETLASSLPPNQCVLITGGTGFIGNRLVEALAAAGHRVYILTRRPEAASTLATPHTVFTSLDQISDDTQIDAIVNLAGEPLANGLWTRRKRARIIRSRVQMTRNIIRLITRLEQTPKVLISASAIGWYGLRDDEFLTEANSGTPCFSHTSCKIIERAARQAEIHGVRVVRLRIGLVLGHQGGLLANLLPPFEFCLGGPIGNGQQWMSWIERDDLIRLISHTLSDNELHGAVNATAPNPVRNAEFTTSLAKALGRPAIFRLPAILLKTLLGDFAHELLLSGQRVLPHKATVNGFRFTHETLESALAYCVGANATQKSKPPISDIAVASPKHSTKE